MEFQCACLSFVCGLRVVTVSSVERKPRAEKIEGKARAIKSFYSLCIDSW